jgi:hypothetical protein
MNESQHPIDALIASTNELLAEMRALSIVTDLFGEHPEQGKVTTHFLVNALRLVAEQTSIIAEMGAKVDVLREEVDNMRNDYDELSNHPAIVVHEQRSNGDRP